MADLPMAVRSRRTAARFQRVARAGLGSSGVLIVIGLVWALVSQEGSAGPVHLTRLASEGSGADRVIALGVLVLSLTPVAGVVTLIVAWWREGDRRFAFTGIAVIAVLVGALLLGRS